MQKNKGYVPKMRTKKLDFAGTEYEGLEVTMTLTIPFGVLEDLKNGSEDNVFEAIPTMLIDWNLCDMETGEPLGKPSKASVKRAPTDIILAIFNKIMDEIERGGTSKNAVVPSDNS